MATIIKHGIFYKENNKCVDLNIEVNCPECNEKVIIYKNTATILPCICGNCACEFICEEKDIKEKENEE